jgi:hypothetical protein
MATYKVYEINFTFNKPKLLTENEFNKIRTRLPFYPTLEDADSMMFKKYWWYIVCLFPPLFVGFIIIPFLSQGYIEPIRYRNSLKKKNEWFQNYYSSIYYSKDYKEYCSKNKELK